MRSLINWLSQILSVTKLSLETVVERRGAALVTVVGIAGVVAVLVGVLSMAAGFRATLAGAGRPDAAIVLRSGADSEIMSLLGGPDVRLIAEAPGILRRNGRPLASAELFAIIDLPKRGTGTTANVPLRGVGAAGAEVRGGIRILEGRMFDPGRNEVVAGIGAAREFAGLKPGSVLRLGRNEWTVTGIFGGGGVAESEIWTDARVLQAAYQRGNSYQAVVVRLASPDTFPAFKEALTTNPQLKVGVLRLDDYYARQSEMVAKVITVFGTFVALMMAAGAVFGALNTMYTAVSARTREIATLRALGFGSAAVMVSVMAEALLLALAGGVLGGGLAYAIFNGATAATMNWQNFSQVAFAFAVTPRLLAQGILYAVAIGLAGGFFPALRAARLPIATALRES